MFGRTGVAKTDDTTDTQPEISLEMSLGNRSARTQEVHYTNVITIKPNDDGGGDRGTHTVTYHSKPVSSTSGGFSVTTSENGDPILNLSYSETTGFDMAATDIWDIEHPYVPDANTLELELNRTELTTRTVQEKRRETNTLTLSINFAELGFVENTETGEATEGEVPETTDSPTQPAQTSLSGITFQSTTTITANGSDITVSDITWHHWDYPSEEIDLENGEVPSGPVFIGDFDSKNETSLNYTYSDNGTGGATGTSTFKRSEGGEWLGDDGTTQSGEVTSGYSHNLVTGEVIFDTPTNTYPPVVRPPNDENTVYTFGYDRSFWDNYSLYVNPWNADRPVAVDNFDVAIQGGQKIAIITAVVSGSAAAALQLAAVTGLSHVGTVGLTRIPAQIGLEWTLWTGAGAGTGVAAEPAQRTFQSVFHKGLLNGGTLSNVRSLSTGINRTSVEALNRVGRVFEFRIPKHVLDRWIETDQARTIRDLDFATGVVNEEIRFGAHLAEELMRYLVQ